MVAKCAGVLNPLTGVCVEKNGKPQTPNATVQLNNYQLGPYCKFMKSFNESSFFTEVAYAYDAAFDAVEKINSHTLQHAADAVPFVDNTFELATGVTYANAVYRNLRKSGRQNVFRSLTTSAYANTPFKMSLMAQLMFSGFFRAPDTIVDQLGGKELTGNPRKGAYWTTWTAEVATALWVFGQEYGQTFNGQKLSNKAKWLWTGGWALYSGYMYGRTDQREFYRLNGKDPKLGDKPWKWKWDGYNPNRYSSDWASNFIGGAAFWSLGPKIGRRVADGVYAKLGMPDYYNNGFKFSPEEKAGLLTSGERNILAKSTLRQELTKLNAGSGARRLLTRLWTGAKWLGRAFRTAGLRRFGYSIAQMFGTTLVASVPLARIGQKARAITEDEHTAKKEETCSYRSSATLHGVSNRTLLSATANNLLFAPLRWAGLDPSIFTYYAPGMALNVYPANSCNEYRGVPHQMALVHLERYRQATTEKEKAHEKALFQFNFALANAEDQEKDIKQYADLSYPQEVRDLFAPFKADRLDLTPEKIAEMFLPLSREDLKQEAFAYKKKILRFPDRPLSASKKEG